MRSRSLSLVFLAVSPAAALSAEVTEADLLAVLREGHPALAAASRLVEEARADSVRAGLLPNPDVDYATERPSGAAKQDEWAVSWALPFDGRRGARLRVAREGEAAAGARSEGLRLAARQRLRGAFVAWLRASERAAALAGHAASLEALAARARARASAGEAAGLEARRLGLEASQARFDLVSAEVERDGARAALAAWTAFPADATPARAALPASPPELDPSLSLEVRARAAEVQIAQAERALASRLLFSPGFRAGYQTQRDPGGGERSGPVFSASLSAPLFDRGQADRSEAAARLGAAEAELAVARAAAAAELPAARAAYDRLAAEARKARDAAGEVSRLEDAARAAWTAGELPVTDLLDTLRSALGARLRDADAHAAALASHAALEVRAGRPLDGDAR